MLRDSTDGRPSGILEGSDRQQQLVLLRLQAQLLLAVRAFEDSGGQQLVLLRLQALSACNRFTKVHKAADLITEIRQRAVIHWRKRGFLGVPHLLHRITIQMRKCGVWPSCITSTKESCY